MGAKFDKDEVHWIDDNGNTLSIYSRSGKIDEGKLILISGRRAAEIILEKESRTQKVRF